MNKTTKSYKQIFAFCDAANSYFSATENFEDTKLGYALKRTFESVQSKTVEYINKLKDLKLEYAMEDINGKVTFTIDIKSGERIYDYTKDGLKALDKACEELFNSTVDVEVYFATSLPEDLAPVYRLLFSGFVIDVSKNEEVEGKVAVESNDI